jgi:hypothetical protein
MHQRKIRRPKVEGRKKSESRRSKAELQGLGPVAERNAHRVLRFEFGRLNEKVHALKIRNLA